MTREAVLALAALPRLQMVTLDGCLGSLVAAACELQVRAEAEGRRLAVSAVNIQSLPVGLATAVGVGSKR